MTSRRLLGFIVSKTWIMVDPLKVEAIVQFPPPCTIPQLPSLQGKLNFIRRFTATYAEITKGFMHLLKNGVPFCWDEATQSSFEVLKCALMSAPLLRPPDYNKYFLLYLDVAESTIGMILAQEDYILEENIIYYLRRGLVGMKLNYSHVDKISLTVIHTVQRFRHYIFLHKTIVIFVVNPFQYVLTR
jgi:hypothetical protein